MAAQESSERPDDEVRVVVILGSTREGRAGGPIADWFLERARDHDGVDVDFVDLAEIELPVVLPEFAPDYTAGTLPEPVAALGDRLEAADAFVVVTCEYNHGYPAPLKNAIDWFNEQWFVKPVAFVSYGSAGGVRAVEQLRLVFAELHAPTTRDGVAIGLDDLDDKGWPDSEGVDGAAALLLDQLAWWARTLRDGRAARSYVM